MILGNRVYTSKFKHTVNSHALWTATWIGCFWSPFWSVRSGWGNDSQPGIHNKKPSDPSVGFKTIENLSQNGKLVQSRLHYKTIKTTTYSSRKAILRGVPIWFTARPSRPVHLGDVSRSSLDERPLGPESTMHVNPLSPQLSQEHLLQCGNGSSVRKKGYSRIRHYVQKPSKGRSPAHSKRRESRAQQGLWSLWKVKSTEKHTAWICLYVLYSIPTES